jgi:hypothetical protein
MECSPPVAADPDHPSASELTLIRARLGPFREAFAVANARTVALR